jgi:aspartokinase
MLKITPALRDLIDKDWMLKFGLHHNLFNLTRLSNFIKPFVQARTKKDISQQALLMALSRYQHTHSKKLPTRVSFSVKNISVQSELVTLTYSADMATSDQIHKLHAKIRRNNGYFALSEGTDEVTLILKKESLELAKKTIRHKVNNEINGLSAIGIKFDPSYSKQPGLLYYLIQFIALQGINIYEISSTFTEVVFYISENDIRLAFDTLIDGLKQD